MSRYTDGEWAYAAAEARAEGAGKYAGDAYHGGGVWTFDEAPRPDIDHRCRACGARLLSDYEVRARRCGTCDTDDQLPAMDHGTVAHPEEDAECPGT